MEARTGVEKQRRLEEAELHRREAEVAQLVHQLLERVREVKRGLLAARGARRRAEADRWRLRPGAHARARQWGARRKRTSAPGAICRGIVVGAEGQVRAVAPGSPARPGRVGFGGGDGGGGRNWTLGGASVASSVAHWAHCEVEAVFGHTEYEEAVPRAAQQLELLRARHRLEGRDAQAEFDAVVQPTRDARRAGDQVLLRETHFDRQRVQRTAHFARSHSHSHRGGCGHLDVRFALADGRRFVDGLAAQSGAEQTACVRERMFERPVLPLVAVVDRAHAARSRLRQRRRHNAASVGARVRRDGHVREAEVGVLGGRSCARLLQRDVRHFAGRRPHERHGRPERHGRVARTDTLRRVAADALRRERRQARRRDGRQRVRSRRVRLRGREQRPQDRPLLWLPLQFAS